MTERRASSLPSMMRFLGEIPPSRETERTLKGVVILVGRSRTGKSTTGRMAAEELGVPFIGIGALFRQVSGVDTGEFINRKASLDARIDKLLAKIVRTSTNVPPMIIDSHLGGHITSIEKEKREEQVLEKGIVISPLPVKTVLLIASEEERWRRAWADTVAKEAEKRVPPEQRSTLEEVTLREQDRSKRDKPHWRINHPLLDDPYNPDLFDIVIDTEGKTIDQVAQEMIEKLGEQDFLISKRGEPKNIELPPSGTIWPKTA